MIYSSIYYDKNISIEPTKSTLVGQNKLLLLISINLYVLMRSIQLLLGTDQLCNMPTNTLTTG